MLGVSPTTAKRMWRDGCRWRKGDRYFSWQLTPLSGISVQTEASEFKCYLNSAHTCSGNVPDWFAPTFTGLSCLTLKNGTSQEGARRSVRRGRHVLRPALRGRKKAHGDEPPRCCRECAVPHEYHPLVVRASLAPEPPPGVAVDREFAMDIAIETTQTVSPCSNSSLLALERIRRPGVGSKNWAMSLPKEPERGLG